MSCTTDAVRMCRPLKNERSRLQELRQIVDEILIDYRQLDCGTLEEAKKLLDKGYSEYTEEWRKDNLARVIRLIAEFMDQLQIKHLQKEI